MTPSVREVAAIRCNFCSRQLPAFRVHRLGAPDRPAQTICDDCLDWHNKAIALLAGGEVSGCQVCGKSWEFLRDSTLGETVRLYVVPRDGIYQVHCETCLAGYVPQRTDLYKGTAFGSKTHIN